jgi:histo-blood group ABO system transferase
MSVALVTVVSGEVYESYAADMFTSAFDFFGPSEVVAHIALPGREGWPDATLYRYHAILEEPALDCFDHVFLIDADMVFVAPVGREILGGLVATVHPGFVGKPSRQLPFERRRESAACCPESETYFCGGFVGGETDQMIRLAESVVQGVDRDAAKGVTAVWHDESHLNKVLSVRPPSVVLSPAYCMPEDSSGYPWLEGVERKLVAVDKTAEERGGR